MGAGGRVALSDFGCRRALGMLWGGWDQRQLGAAGRRKRLSEACRTTVRLRSRQPPSPSPSQLQQGAGRPGQRRRRRVRPLQRHPRLLGPRNDEAARALPVGGWVGGRAGGRELQPKGNIGCAAWRAGVRMAGRCWTLLKAACSLPAQRCWGGPPPHRAHPAGPHCLWHAFPPRAAAAPPAGGALPTCTPWGPASSRLSSAAYPSSRCRG